MRLQHLTTLARERQQAPQISSRPERLVERARREELLRSPAVTVNDTGCEEGEYESVMSLADSNLLASHFLTLAQNNCTPAKPHTCCMLLKASRLPPDILTASKSAQIKKCRRTKAAFSFALEQRQNNR